MGLIDLISAVWSIQSVQEYFLNTLLLFNGWLATITSLFTKILSLSVVARAYTSIPIIQETWRILRDFSNMLFIVALIVMAFGTVFNKEDYSFNKLFPKFLIAAVFINFSLVIGGLVIDGFQVLTNVFLVSIGNLGDRLGQSFNLASLLPNAGQGVNVEEIASNADLLGSAILSLIFLTALSLFFLFAVAVSAVFSVARIPILWGLLILSPIAWMASIFPKTRNFFDNWWRWFIGWNMFLPIYLFFLSLGLLFLSRRNEIGTILPTGSGDQSLVEGIAGSLTFNLFFFYGFTMAILVFGLSWALKLSSQGGSWMTGTINWARGAAMRLPGLSQYDATRRAAGKRFEQFRQEGFQGRLGRLPIIGYGGAEGLEAQRKSYERMFGVRGAEFAKSKDFAMRAKREQDIIREQYQLGTITPDEISLRARQMSTKDPRGFAYANLSAELGRLENDLFDKVLKEVSGDPLAIKTFTETARKSKFGGVRPSELVEMAVAKGKDDRYKYLENKPAVRREILEFIQSSPIALRNLDLPKYEATINLLGGPRSKEAREFRREAEKVRPDLEIKYIHTPSVVTNEILELRKEIAEQHKDAEGIPRLPNGVDLYTEKLGDPKNIANLPFDVWKEQDFQTGLVEHMKQFSHIPSLNRFISRLYEQVNIAFESKQKADLLTKLIEKAPEIKDRINIRQAGRAGESQGEQTRTSGQGRAGQQNRTPNTENQPPQAGTVSFEVNPNNTLDLRTIQSKDDEEDDII